MYLSSACMSLILATIFGFLSPDDKLLTKDIVGNRQVRLISAWTSNKRGQNLMAKFATVDERHPEEFQIEFPAHCHSPHETTLMKIVQSSVDWSEPNAADQPHMALVDVVFSIPADSKGYVTDYEKWWLVSIDRSDLNHNSFSAINQSQDDFTTLARLQQTSVTGNRISATVQDKVDLDNGIRNGADNAIDAVDNKTASHEPLPTEISKPRIVGLCIR